MKKPILIELIIWIFILTLIFSGIIFGYSKIFVEPHTYTIHFKDIDGITKGSPVRFMGINVGYVRKLKAHKKHVNVQIIITQKNVMIPNGTIAKVEFFGLGGSKSIELMPPDGSSDIGILTGDTIRIADVAKEANSMVEIVEEIEKYIKGLNASNMEKLLKTIVDIKDDTLKNQANNIENIESTVTTKIETVKEKQKNIEERIKQVNTNAEKINKFIKN